MPDRKPTIEHGRFARDLAKSAIYCRASMPGFRKEVAWGRLLGKGAVLTSVSDLTLSERSLSESIEVVREEEKQLVERIEKQEERYGELSELVMQIEDHIEGSVCPVCGEDSWYARNAA